MSIFDNQSFTLNIHAMSILSVHVFIFTSFDKYMGGFYIRKTSSNFIISILPIMAIVPLRLVLWYFNQKK